MRRFPAKRTLTNARPSTYKSRNAQYDKLSQTRRQATPNPAPANGRKFPREISKNQNRPQPRAGVETRQVGRCDRGTRKGSRIRNPERDTYDCGVQVLAESTCEDRESRGKVHSLVSSHRRESSRYECQASTLE